MKSAKRKAQNKGFVLITTLIIMVVLLGVSFSLLKAVISELTISRSQKAGTTCFYLAEAGVQEAIWRVRNDSGTRDKFLNSNDGLTNFSHDSGLTEGGSYDVIIQNSAPGMAAITSTGHYQLAGSANAQRMIRVNIAEAIGESPLDNVAGFTGGASGNEDIEIAAANVDVNGGSLVANRDIRIWILAYVDVEQDVKAVRNIDVWPFSTLKTGGEQITGIDPLEMPSVDFDSSDPNSLKNKAAAQSQVYTQQQFRNMLNSDSNLTLDGYVYVTGNIEIRWGRHLTVNGILAADGSIDVGASIFSGELTINHPDSGGSGVLSKQHLNINGGGTANVNGIVYVGNKFDIDAAIYKNINITGAIYSRRISALGFRNIVIDYNMDYVNEVIPPAPPETPIIEVQHWEEEY